MRRVEKLSQKQKLEFLFDLVNAFSIVRTPTDTANFIQDVLTANEIRNLAVRLRIAKLLLSGKTYQEIGEETKTSSATITKVNAWINRGGEGFKNVIRKLPLKYQYPEKLSHGPIEYHLPELILKGIQCGVAVFQDRRLKKLGSDISEKENFDREFRQNTSESYVRNLSTNQTL